MKKKQPKNIFKLISIIFWIALLITSIISLVIIIKSNLLPLKYLIIGSVILIVINIIIGIISLLKEHHKWCYILTMIIITLIIALEIFLAVIINNTTHFLKNISVHYNTDTYYILVNSNSSLNTIDDLQNHELNVFKDLDDMSKVEEKIKEKLNGSINYSNDIASLFNEILINNDYVIIVNSGNYEAMAAIDNDFEEQVKIIDNILITTELDIKPVDVNTGKEPFVLYISGIDTRSNYMPSRSLSDVNIVLAVNPQTKNILMIHIPRDSYVYLHGIDTNLKDKLTHSGTVGGIMLSKATIEDLLHIEIPYYLRVNFYSVINLVDAIGGITVNSDVDYQLNLYSSIKKEKCTITPGLNNLDGGCALSFARERKSYETGDRHRGENQEQVIEKIIEKASKSSTILNSYSDILKALEGTFETNVSDTDITNLIKMQLNDMASWHIETSNITGTGAMLPTYCYPGRNLYVMNVDEQSVNIAVDKLNKVLNEG